MFGPEMQRHFLKRDLVVGEIDMLDLDGGPTSLTKPFLAIVLFALPFDANPFVFDDGTCVGRFCLEVGTFQVSDAGLEVCQWRQRPKRDDATYIQDLNLT